MRNKSCSLIAVAVLIATACIIPAQAGKKKYGASAGDGNTPAPSMSPLTASECERLGGTVIDSASNSCSSTGKACFTSTRKNGDHWVCITEAN